MKKSHPAIYILLLVSFISFDTIAQVRTESRIFYEDHQAQKRQKEFRQRLSETICNQSWLAEATGEDVRSELTVFDQEFINWLFSSDLKERLISFVASNNACDTGDTPLRLALNAEADDSVVDTLRSFGADVSVANSDDGVTPIDLRASHTIVTAEDEDRFQVRSYGGCPPEQRPVVVRNGAVFCR